MDKLITNLVARFPELTEADILVSVEVITDAMAATLVNGGRIELRGFGSFSLNMRMLRSLKSTNTVDGECRDALPVVHFKPGLVIRNRINNPRTCPANAC